jgi:excisionase family DNA binding protein
MESYLTAREVAELLRITTSTLAAWRWQEKGPPFVKFGTAVRYSHSGLEAWIKEKTAA